MDIVNDIDQAKPSEVTVIPEESLVGKPYTEEIFDDEWRGTYLHLTETLHRTFEQVGVAVRANMEIADPDFDPDTNTKDKNAFEAAVMTKVREVGAYDGIMGMLKMAMVMYFNIAKRYGFPYEDIQSTLKEMTADTDVNTNLQQYLGDLEDGSKV